MKVLDQSHDRLGVELYRLASIYEPPGFVKQASESTLRGEGEMPAQCYADQQGRLFPVHTPAATWTSSAYFLEKCAGLPRAYADGVGRRLLGMAQFWGILPQVEKLASEIALSQRKSDETLPDDAFALVEVLDDGSKERMLPLRNGEEVKAAAAWLVTYRDAFPFEDRQTVATRVLQKAAEHDANLAEYSDTLDRMAGFGGCAVKQARAAVVERAGLLARKDPEAAARLREVADAIGSPDRERYTKLAAVLDDVDRRTGLSRLYNEGLTRPEDVLFALTEKVASEVRYDNVETTTGSVYAKTDLRRLTDLDKVAEYMGSKFAEAVASPSGLYVDSEKLAAILATAPRDDAAIFDRLMSESGLSATSARTPDPASPLSLAGLAGVLGD